MSVMDRQGTGEHLAGHKMNQDQQACGKEAHKAYGSGEHLRRLAPRIQGMGHEQAGAVRGQEVDEVAAPL